MISQKQTIKEQFQIFYQNHKANNFEDALEKFAIFGGVEWGKVDTTEDSFSLIESLILKDYRYIRNDINELTSGAPVYHAILTGIAQGDGRVHSSFKRANVSQEVGERAVEELVERGVLRMETAKKEFTSWDTYEKIDDKLHFTSPFIRFWFAFISPLFKGIRDGDFEEVKQKFFNNEQNFTQQPFIDLSHELLKLSFKEDSIESIGSYWDRKVSLDIFAKTVSGKTVVGSCRYTNAKVKKSELSRLQTLSKEANIEADIFVIVAKKGFSSELKAIKGKTLQLYTLKNFKLLVDT